MHIKDRRQSKIKDYIMMKCQNQNEKCLFSLKKV